MFIVLVPAPGRWCCCASLSETLLPYLSVLLQPGKEQYLPVDSIRSLPSTRTFSSRLPFLSESPLGVEVALSRRTLCAHQRATSTASELRQQLPNPQRTRDNTRSLFLHSSCSLSSSRIPPSPLSSVSTIQQRTITYHDLTRIHPFVLTFLTLHRRVKSSSYRNPPASPFIHPYEVRPSGRRPCQTPPRDNLPSDMPFGDPDHPRVILGWVIDKLVDLDMYVRDRILPGLRNWWERMTT